jgi:hypothetical protein
MEIKYWNNLGYYEMVGLYVVSVLSEKAVQGVEYCPAEGRHCGWVVPDGMAVYYEEGRENLVLITKGEK